MIRKIMVPVAAFAVTVTGASAFNSDMLEKIGVNLSDDQVSALEEANELKQAGAERDEVVAVLEDAGLDKEKMMEMREAAKEYHQAHREAVKEAIESADYDAYLEAVADTPRVEIIDSEEDFDKLVEAHQLRADGDNEGAREIMEELGFSGEHKPHKGKFGGERGGHRQAKTD